MSLQKFRVSDYVQGQQSWNSALLFITFFDGNGQVGEDIAVGKLRENAPEWKLVENEVEIPSGALTFKVKAGIWGSAGTLDIADIIVGQRK